MKKIFLILSVTTLLTSCADYSTSTPKDQKGNPINKQRIHGIEYTVFEGHGYAIIEIDGVEYLSNTQGGICPLVRDTIKQ